MIAPPETTSTKQTASTKQSKKSVSFTESASYWTGIAAVAFTVLAAMAGLFSWYFSLRVSAEKDAALARFHDELRATTASADARAAEANKKAAEAVEGAATANERAKILELETATQQQRAATAERDLLLLQQRLAWRSLTAEHESLLTRLLGQFGGTPVSVLKLGDPEAGPLADRLIAVLRAAKWRVTVNFAGSMSPPVFGIRCSHASADATGSALVKALQSVGLVVTEHRDTGAGIDIVVGLKPPA